MSTFGERLRVLRNEKNLTQKELGKILNITNRSISQYEQNYSQVPDDLKIKIAMFFSVSLDYMFGMSDHRVHQPTSEAAELEGKLMEVVKQVLIDNNEISSSDSLDIKNITSVGNILELSYNIRQVK